MSLNRLLTATAALALAAGLSAPQVAVAQSTATAKTEPAAKAATGKATTDKPANTQVQGTARAVSEAAPAVQNAQTAAGANTSAAAPAASSARPVTPSGDLVDTLKASGQFNTFLKAVDSTNLTQVLKRHSNLTVFAPTDAAFAALPPGELQKLMADKAALQKLLTHHIINAPVDSAKIKGARGPVPSVAQDQILLDGSEETALKADGANIVQADVRASNGILHVVDRVLRPGEGGTAEAAPTGQAAGSSANAPAPQQGTNSKPQ